MALALLDLPQELLLVVGTKLGNTCGGLVAQARMRSTCKHLLAVLSIFLGDGRVKLSLSQLASYVHLVRIRPLFVFDLCSQRVLKLSWDKALLKYDFAGRPASNCRLFVPDNVLLWYLDTHHCVGLSERTRGDSWCKNVLSLKQLKTLCSEEETLRLISAPESEVVARRRGDSFQPSLVSAWEFVLTTCMKASQGITELDLEAPRAEASAGLFPVAPLLSIMARLHTLKLQSVVIDRPSSVLRASYNIQHLDLSESVSFGDVAFCFDVGRLLLEWRSHPLDEKKVLVIDDVPFDTTEHGLVRIVYGAWQKGTGTVDAVNDTSFVFSYGEGAPLTFVSLSGVSWGEWLSSIKFVEGSDSDLLEYPNVKLVSEELNQATEKPLSKKQKLKRTMLKPDVASSSASALVGLPSSPLIPAGHYSNFTRERDRYMIQWYASQCKNCGCWWKEDAVTISFRQTAVSECFKGKKSCAQRKEYIRMQNGEKWITDRHMPGNGGNDLTPSSEEIVEAKAHGLIVAVDPHTKKRVYFKPLNRDGAKVPAFWPTG